MSIVTGDYHHTLTATDAQNYAKHFADGYSLKGVVDDEYRSLCDVHGDAGIQREDVEASLRKFLDFHGVAAPGQ